MENYIGEICPICKTEIKEGEAVKVCDTCSVEHHQGCWDEHKGCSTCECASPEEATSEGVPLDDITTDGSDAICPEQNDEGQDTSATDACKSCGAVLVDGEEFCRQCGTPKQVIAQNVCEQCGAELGAGQRFCPQCGTSKQAPAENVCEQCGANLAYGQEFCPQCGQRTVFAVNNSVTPLIGSLNMGTEKQKSKKKSKILAIILAGVLVVCGIVGYFVYSTIETNKKEAAIAAREEAIATYIEDARAFQSEMVDAGSSMEKIGNSIEKKWRGYIYGTEDYDSIDDAVFAAQLDEITNIEAVKSSQPTIELLYTDLMKLPVDDDPDLKFKMHTTLTAVCMTA